MTHFAAVLIYKPTPQDGNLSPIKVQDKFVDLLAPFSEHLKADPYVDECFCQAEHMAQYRLDLEKEGKVCEECNGTGRHSSTYNPKSKWDWYQFGGRFSMHAFTPKPGVQFAAPDLSWGFNDAEPAVIEEAMSKAVIIRKGDVDWDRMNEQRLAGLSQHYDVAIEEFKKAAKDLRKDTEKYVQLVARTKWLDQLETDLDGNWESKDAYLERNNRWNPGGLVVDGVWHEQGEHGWFGTQETGIGQKAWQDQVNEIMAATPDDAWLAYVDCHI